MASVTRNPRPLFVTTLPAGYDGQEVFYQSTAAGSGGGASNSMADVGAVWHLRYRDAGASGKKWEFVGGANVTSQYAPSETSASLGSLTYGAVSSNDPSIVAPLAGDYLLVHRATLRSPGIASTGLYIGIKRGSTEAVIDEIHGSDAAMPVSNYGCSLTAQSQITLTSSPDIRTITQRYAQGSGGSNTVIAKVRSLSIRPIRVG